MTPAGCGSPPAPASASRRSGSSPPGSGSPSPTDRRPAVVVRRAAFAVLALAAGLVGLGLLAAPGATERYFAWGLAPEPLAAFAGAVYIGSAVVYLAALARPWEEVRGLVAAAALLSVSVLAITLVHLDQFDLDRLQAWAWIVLFAGFSLLTLSLLAICDPGDSGPSGGRLVGFARVALGTAALALAALALALWIDPGRVAGPSPFDLPPLGGRFAGSWVALLALLAGAGAVDGRAAPARPAALALLVLPALALVAAARTASDLDPAGAAIADVAALVALATTGGAILAAIRERRAAGG
ncbi:MAG TPA: hypothetical protein VK919_07225 [Solirubrobacterales bacterium]|nr:hypothetical protein [Solirubrobacterales bacterium]